MKEIESCSYKLMMFCLYIHLIKLNPENKIEHHKLLTEEGIAETCNVIPTEILYTFASISKRVKSSDL